MRIDSRPEMKLFLLGLSNSARTENLSVLHHQTTRSPSFHFSLNLKFLNTCILFPFVVDLLQNFSSTCTLSTSAFSDIVWKTIHIENLECKLCEAQLLARKDKIKT